MNTPEQNPLDPYLRGRALKIRFNAPSKGDSVHATLVFPVLTDADLFTVRTHLDELFAEDGLRAGLIIGKEFERVSATVLHYQFLNSEFGAVAANIKLLKDIYGRPRAVPRPRLVDATRKADAPGPQTP